MRKTTPRFTRRHIDGQTHDLLARLSAKLEQVRAYDRFASGRRDADTAGSPSHRQDAEHAELLLTALRMRLRTTPGRPVRGRDRADG